MEEHIEQKLGTKDEFGQPLLPPMPEYAKMVTLLLSNLSPNTKKDLHCLNCGRIVAQYYSEARVIIIGEMREVQRPIDVMCSRCKIMYRIG